MPTLLPLLRNSAAQTLPSPSSELRFQKSPTNVLPKGYGFQTCWVESLLRPALS